MELENIGSVRERCKNFTIFKYSGTKYLACLCVKRERRRIRTFVDIYRILDHQIEYERRIHLRERIIPIMPWSLIVILSYIPLILTIQMISLDFLSNLAGPINVIFVFLFLMWMLLNIFLYETDPEYAGGISWDSRVKALAIPYYDGMVRYYCLDGKIKHEVYLDPLNLKKMWKLRVLVLIIGSCINSVYGLIMALIQKIAPYSSTRIPIQPIITIIVLLVAMFLIFLFLLPSVILANLLLPIKTAYACDGKILFVKPKNVISLFHNSLLLADFGGSVEVLSTIRDISISGLLAYRNMEWIVVWSMFRIYVYRRGVLQLEVEPKLYRVHGRRVRIYETILSAHYLVDVAIIIAITDFSKVFIIDPTRSTEISHKLEITPKSISFYAKEVYIITPENKVVRFHIPLNLSKLEYLL